MNVADRRELRIYLVRPILKLSKGKQLGVHSFWHEFIRGRPKMNLQAIAHQSHVPRELWAGGN